MRKKQNVKRFLILIVTTIVFSFLMLIWGYADRGYVAFGGEGLLPIVYVVVYVKVWWSECQERQGGKTEQK